MGESVARFAGFARCSRHDPGVSLRSTPGLTLPPAPQAGKPKPVNFLDRQQ